MPEPDHACELEGCDSTADAAHDEDDGAWPNPPPGWLSVVVCRHDAQTVTFEFCSEEHMRQGLQAPLPLARPTSGADSRWYDTVLAGVAVLLFLGCLLLGAVTALSLLLDVF